MTRLERFYLWLACGVVITISLVLMYLIGDFDVGLHIMERV